MEQFWKSSAFRSRLGPATRWRMPTDEELTLLDDADPLLGELIRCDGWATYRDGLVRVHPPSSLAKAFDPSLLDPGKVLLYVTSAWGHVVAVGAAESTLVDPLFEEDASWPFDAVSTLDGALVVEDIVEDAWLAPLYRLVRSRLPAPTAEQVYAFGPPLALGGALEAEAVELRDLVATLHLLLQLRQA